MSSYSTKNIENIFDKENAISLRKALIQGVDFLKPVEISEGLYIVINPSDRCPVACPNCLYSSINSSEKKAFISKSEAVKMAKIMNEAQTKMIVFSGGGESLENIVAITEILEKTNSLVDCIIITSGYFADTEISTKKVLDKIVKSASENRIKKGLKSVLLTIRISYDNDHCIKIPVQNIANVINYAKSLSDVTMRVLVRTILSKNENRDSELAECLKMEIIPSKNKNKPFDNLPILDGLPCRWLNDGKSGFSIPIIYKPVYFLGRGQKSKEKRNWSYLKVIKSEKESGSKFNLCLRGTKGEGHNYYETLFFGYKFWKKHGSFEYNAKKNDKQKGLALYLPADGRLIVNSGVPDIFMYLYDIKNWKHFLDFVYTDPIQRNLIKEGPFYIRKIASEVMPDLKKKIKKANFVFSISLLSLDSSAIRLYVTIRLLQKMLKMKEISVNTKEAQNLLNLSPKLLKETFFAQAISEPNKSIDPIIGSEKSLFYV